MISPRPLMLPPKKQEITQGLQIWMTAGTESLQKFAKFRQLPTVARQSELGMLKEDPFARNLPKIIEIAPFLPP